MKELNGFQRLALAAELCSLGFTPAEASSIMSDPSIRTEADAYDAITACL